MNKIIDGHRALKELKYLYKTTRYAGINRGLALNLMMQKKAEEMIR